MAKPIGLVRDLTRKNVRATIGENLRISTNNFELILDLWKRAIEIELSPMIGVPISWTNKTAELDQHVRTSVRRVHLPFTLFNENCSPVHTKPSNHLTQMLVKIL